MLLTIVSHREVPLIIAITKYNCDIDAPVIFMSAGFTSVSSSLFLTGIFGVVKVVSATAFMFYFVKIKGNRFWLKLGSLVCGISMLVLGRSFRLRFKKAPAYRRRYIAYFVRLLPPPTELQEAKLTIGGVISVLMVYVFAFFFGVSLGPISWNVCSEVSVLVPPYAHSINISYDKIFPLHLNAKCCAITTCTQWLFQVCLLPHSCQPFTNYNRRLLLPPLPHGCLLRWVGLPSKLSTAISLVKPSSPDISSIIYAVFCLVSYVWVSLCVPETRGVALGWAMDQVFGGSPEDAPVEDLETTSLLQNEHRRSSVVSYT